MINVILFILIGTFLAINMGASGFSISFTPSCGSNLLKKNQAVILYTIFLLMGAVLIGPRVVETLIQKISQQKISESSGLIILISTVITMFAANMLKIPQSTSFVTVSAFTGAGLFYHQLNWFTILKVFSFAVLFSVLAFGLTYLIASRFYPPRNDNLRLYEKTFNHRNKLRKFIVWTDCYSAFAVGTNNVANVVSPLLTSLTINPVMALAVTAPFFGLGGHVLGKGVLNTISKEIVPIGETSAGIVSLVTSSFVIIASLLGLPTPYVQFTTFSVLAISSLKDGFKVTFKKFIVRKIIFVWIIIPLITCGLSYFMHVLFLR